MWRDDGRCGPAYKLPNESPIWENDIPAQCNPNGFAEKVGPCCNLDSGWCGNSNTDCQCKNCTNYATGKS